MTTEPHPLSILASCGFVSALTLTGLWALPAPHEWTDAPSVLRGQFQAAYTDDFDAALPFMDFATSAVALTRYAVFGQAKDGALVGDDGWLFTTEDLTIGPDFDAHIQRNAAHVADVNRQLASNGTALIVAVIPDKSAVYADKLGLRRPDQIEARRKSFVSALAAQGVEVVDLGPVLTDARRDGAVFLHDDTHWSPFGAETSARAIAASPVLQGLELAPATSTTDSVGRVPHNGDLLNFIPTGALRAYGGPPQRFVEQTVTQTDAGGGLFGDAAPEVALIGTSYSAMETWNFAGFLETALQSDVINLSSAGYGPFAPMRDFLASQEASDLPLKAVIWEIPARYVSTEK